MGAYWIRLRLDSYTASRRRTGLRYKSANSYMAIKTVLKLLALKLRSLP